MVGSFPGRAVLFAAAAVLLWRIVAVNAVQYDAAGAVRSGVGGPASMLAAEVRENPSDTRRLLELALRAASDGQPERARAYLQAARGIAPRDPQVWELEAADLIASGRVDAAAARLSDITATFEAHAWTFPVFAGLLAAGHPALQAVVSRDPPWLGHFILDQCGRGTNPLLLTPLAQQRATSARGAALPEVVCVIERLRDAGQWEAAYQLWLNSLPASRLASVGYVFNGSFGSAASGTGFDWRPDRAPDRESGHTVEFAPTRDAADGRALRVSYNGKRQSSAAILQYLAAPAGSYRLQGRVRVEAVNSPRGVQWVLRCAADAARPPLGASERFLGASGWREFSFDVDLPAGCAGQLLQLEAVGAGQGTTFLSGSLWFDDLALVVRR